MLSCRNKFDSGVKSKEENRRLKDKLCMIEQGKIPKSKKDTDTEDMLYMLKSKIESLKKIRKAKMNKYRAAIKQAVRQVEAVEEEILNNQVKLDELSKENSNKSKSVWKLKKMVGLKVNRSTGIIQTNENAFE